MKSKIKENIAQPNQLEQLYRTDKKGFEKAFYDIYPEISDQPLAGYWKTRLDYENQPNVRVNMRKTDLLFLLLTCLLTGFLIKLPQIFNFSPSENLFFERNAGLIVFLGLSMYAFLTKEKLSFKQLFFSVAVFVLSAVYINLLPLQGTSNSVQLAAIHLPLMLWCLYGLIFIDFSNKNKNKRIDYIRYNGDLAILGAIILIAGGILTGVTMGLFEAIDINIEEFYINYIVIIGLVSAPVVATYIINKFPMITHKIAPVIAAIFSPIVLITLVVYLIIILVTGQDLYNDRDFLFVFNLLLLGVMAIIVFSVSETMANKKQRWNEIILLALAIITLITDIVALSAIVYRLGEFGFTPNRVAVLGSNLLVFGHLIIIMVDLFKVNFKNKEIKLVETTIAGYLPVYMVWTVIMVFVLPFIFGLK
jgi:hypothetical protein